eukprot:5711020-Prymnesium_polylepis.1
MEITLHTSQRSTAVKADFAAAHFGFGAVAATVAAVSCEFIAHWKWGLGPHAGQWQTGRQGCAHEQGLLSGPRAASVHTSHHGPRVSCMRLVRERWG